jgi:hypothetical protein
MVLNGVCWHEKSPPKEGEQGKYEQDPEADRSRFWGGDKKILLPL